MNNKKSDFKIITFAVPCYNSEDYMEHCVDSILSCESSDIEIILINDGSRDSTGEICDRYSLKYPDTIKVIHQGNSGHGEGVNQGLKNAGGVYYKVVDSDDWLDSGSLEKLLNQLRAFYKQNNTPDLVICNYVYEHVSDNKSVPINYTDVLPQNCVFTWNDCGKFGLSQYILMHSAVYKTSVLRDCGLVLPKHTFYVDNLFVYVPFPSVKSLYYMDINLYRYYIGREDQSVNEAVMVKRFDQQIRVTKLMISSHKLSEIKDNPKLVKYMCRYLAMMMTICCILITIEDSPDADAKKRELWSYLKNSDEKIYKKIRFSALPFLSNLKTRAGRYISVSAYRLAKKKYKFS